MDYKDKLNIFLVDSHCNITRGGAVQCANLAIGLTQIGYKVSCFFDEPDKKKYYNHFKLFHKSQIPIYFYNFKKPLSLLYLRKKILEDQPDIIHTHKNRALIAIYLATLNKRQFIWFANRGTVYSLKTNPLAYYIYKRYIDKTIAVSKAVKESLIKDGIDESKIEVVYGSFDPERFHPGINGLQMRQKWAVPDEAKLVGLIGSFNSFKKGQDIFLKAAKLILDTRPNTYFVLIGDGKYKKYYKLAKTLGIERNVIFAGFCKDIHYAIAALDIVVCASIQGEGLTGSLREALAMEKPVVSTDVAGNSEIVHDQLTGLLVPPADQDALAKAIIFLLDNPEIAKTYARQGRKLVYNICTNEKRAITIVELYKKALYSNQ